MSVFSLLHPVTLSVPLKGGWLELFLSLGPRNQSLIVYVQLIAEKGLLTTPGLS